jgi:tetratricopeptide (TPR) repeat protein
VEAQPQADLNPKVAKLRLAASAALSRIPWPAVTLALTLLALLYALLAGLHTVFDMDMGWHLATGRWVAHHHAVPATDVLSYTSPGAEWLYPPFAGWLLYGVFSAWGYPGLSWFCALVLTATAACLLRNPRSRESGIAAALAVLAVPLLAGRATPRADLFTPLLFAIFLLRLWRFHRTDPFDGPAIRRQGRLLWVLPVSMMLWVNLHPGFIAGLGLIVAYFAIEALDALSAPQQRAAAARRLRLAGPALAATFCATLVNPYGLRVFKASLQLAGLAGAGPQTDRAVVEELAPVPLSLTPVLQSLDWRGPNTFWWLALAAVAIIVVALRRRQFGPALLIGAALCGSIEHRRYIALFAITVVVIGATVLAEALQRMQSSGATGSSTRRSALAALAAVTLLLVSCVRIADLVSSHLYIVANTPMQFGAGESWWYPERAAAFIRSQRLPGNIFQLYNLGGFTAWRLGPEYPDFIDGRNLSQAVLAEEHDLLTSSPDSATWTAEADRRGINVLFFSVARFSGVGSPNLLSLCQSTEWRPIYMDEVALVLLRNRAENQPWLQRYAIDCRTHVFTPPPAASSLDLANFYANAGDILLNLGRLSEAQEALAHASSLSPDDPSVHLATGQLLEAQGRPDDAEDEYKTTLSLAQEPELALLCLGRFYYAQGRLADARPLILHASQLSTMPAGDLSLLGTIDLRLGQTTTALTDFARAESIGKQYLEGGEDKNPAFFAQLASGRAAAYYQLGQLPRAIEFQQLATQKTPDDPAAWKALAELYDKSGQPQLAEQAYRRASALAH